MGYAGSVDGTGGDTFQEVWLNDPETVSVVSGYFQGGEDAKYTHEDGIG
jgi:hypothetical protein